APLPSALVKPDGRPTLAAAPPRRMPPNHQLGADPSVDALITKATVQLQASLEAVEAAARAAGAAASGWISVPTDARRVAEWLSRVPLRPAPAGKLALARDASPTSIHAGGIHREDARPDEELRSDRRRTGFEALRRERPERLVQARLCFLRSGARQFGRRSCDMTRPPARAAGTHWLARQPCRPTRANGNGRISTALTSLRSTFPLRARLFHPASSMSIVSG